MPLLGIGDRAAYSFLLFLVLAKFFAYRIAGAIAIAVVLYQIFETYRKITIWKRLGVPASPGWLFFGNSFDYMTKGPHGCDLEWQQKYGPVHGAYIPPYPELIISDKELLKKVFVKDFHNFTNRKHTDYGKQKTIFSRLLGSLKDDEWKRMRGMTSPAFTSGKLKGLKHLMDKSINVCLEILTEKGEEADGVETKPLLANLTLDIVAASAFALDTDVQRNPDNQFLHFCNTFITYRLAKHNRPSRFRDWRVMILVLFPYTTAKLREWFNIQVVSPGLEEFYIESLGRIIKERRANPLTDHVDFLQIMIDSADSKHNNNETKMDDHAQSDRQAFDSDKISSVDFDIISQSFTMLTSGQETTSNTLNFAVYLLAMHPDVQRRVLDELLQLTPNGEPITYEHMQNRSVYLEAVMSETLRLFPLVVRCDRHSLTDYQLTDQLTIPKDTTVTMPIFAIHHDPKNYEDPEKFDPDRFINNDFFKTEPFIYVPFGSGPRNCVGMRFALLEMKLIVASIVRKFEIKPTATTLPFPPEMDNTTTVLRPRVPFRLRFIKRTN